MKLKIRITTGYLTPETMKLFGNTKGKITKEKNGENAPHLEFTEAVSIQDIFKNNYQHYSRVLYTFFPS